MIINNTPLASKNDIEVMKKEVKKKLADALVLGIRTKKLSLKEMKSSAIYILDNIDLVHDYSQLIVFLDNLKMQWPVYSNIYTTYSSVLAKQKEEAVINRLSSYIKTLS